MRFSIFSFCRRQEAVKISGEQVAEDFEKKYENGSSSSSNALPELEQIARSNMVLFSKMMQTYKRHNTATLLLNKFYKFIYFAGSIWVLQIITTLLANVVLKPSGHMLSDSMIASVVSFITGFIVLPVTITKYLFNPNETKDLTGLVQTIQIHDEIMLGKLESRKQWPVATQSANSEDTPKQQDSIPDVEKAQ